MGRSLLLILFYSCSTLVSRAGEMGIYIDNTYFDNPSNLASSSERESYIQKFTLRYRKAFTSFSANKRGLMKYFEERLIHHNLPVELKSLAYMESALEITALSHAGARGPWQLMPGTARDYGLTVNAQVDERVSVEKSTYAAIMYLKKLHRYYKDWTLAVAAYNYGEGNLDNAIRRAGGSRNILVLESYLPTETREYVRRFEAATRAWVGVSGGEAIAYTPISPEAVNIPERESAEDALEKKLLKKGLSSVSINAGYRLDVIAEILSVPEKKLRELNADFDKKMEQYGTASLILPKEKITDFKLHSGTILMESLQRTDAEFN